MAALFLEQIWVLHYYIGGDYRFTSYIILLVEMSCSGRVVMEARGSM